MLLAVSTTNPKSFTRILRALFGGENCSETIRAPLSENIQLLPALLLMISSSIALSKPAFSPKARASAATALCTQTMS